VQSFRRYLISIGGMFILGWMVSGPILLVINQVALGVAIFFLITSGSVGLGFLIYQRWDQTNLERKWALIPIAIASIILSSFILILGVSLIQPPAGEQVSETTQQTANLLIGAGVGLGLALSFFNYWLADKWGQQRQN
jgi:hypothetical protein